MIDTTQKDNAADEQSKRAREEEIKAAEAHNLAAAEHKKHADEQMGKSKLP